MNLFHDKSTAEFIPPAASECSKTPGHHYGFWEATVLCTGSASGAGQVSPGAFSPSGSSSTISVSLATASKFWVSYLSLLLIIAIDHKTELEAIFFPSLLHIPLGLFEEWLLPANSCIEFPRSSWFAHPSPSLHVLVNTEFLFLLWWGIGLQYRGLFSGLPGFFTLQKLVESEQRFVQPEPSSSPWKREAASIPAWKLGAASVWLKAPSSRRSISNWNTGFDGKGHYSSSSHLQR